MAGFFDINKNTGKITKILTAADIKLWIGDHDLGTTGETKREKHISGLAKLTHHPDGEFPNIQVGQDYSSLYGPFDISILELKAEDALDLRTYPPACLAKSSDRDSFDNQLATVAGWGCLKENGEIQDEPHDVEVRVRPVSDCPGFQADGVTEVSPSDICAAVDGGGKDACQVFHTNTKYFKT